jgi:hypothetical protein
MNSDKPESVPISEVVKQTAKPHPKAKALGAALFPITRVYEDLKTCEDLPSLFTILEGSNFLDVMGNAVEVAGKLMDEVQPRTPTKPGPNSRCGCGSGKKFKRCCGKAGARKRAIARRREAFEKAMAASEKSESGEPKSAAPEGEAPKD